MGFYRGGPVLMSALSGIDIALWDLKGAHFLSTQIGHPRINNCYQTARRLGLPIYELLGGKVRDKLRVYAWIGGDRPNDVAIQA